MGRNAGIRRYDPHPDGQPIDLFDSAEGRLPVVLELLRSPWIRRGSDLESGGGATACKRVHKPLEVEWDGAKRAPARFRLHGRRYRVDALVQTWTVERRWWDPKRSESLRCFRVMSRGGIYDIAYDRHEETWFLSGIVD
jgi:hypothetical protein